MFCRRRVLRFPTGTAFGWHGRGDKQTDIHFIYERLNRDGPIKPTGAIVVHPFGRHCLGFKSAGEIDVLEAIGHVSSQYRIDPDRIVLMGFSMGGAGTWHVGAHYTDLFVACSPGAGFVETARYNNLPPDNYPPPYEQQLWGLYDVPNYVRNLFNRPVIAYSGELDKQIQAARMMEDAFREHGQTLNHVIGPGMGHKYHPDSLAQILDELAKAVAQGRPKRPPRVTLQTRTLRYNRMDWLEALRLGEHWHDARIDAEFKSVLNLDIVTKNVTAFRVAPPWSFRGRITIDGQTIERITGNVVYPNPQHRQKYIVVNSGPTFREAHDRTNSLQNPKLPDWAVVDISQAPSASAPGRIVAADFFDEQWRLMDDG